MRVVFNPGTYIYRSVSIYAILPKPSGDVTLGLVPLSGFETAVLALRTIAHKDYTEEEFDFAVPEIG